MKIGRSKPAKVDNPTPTGFTKEQKRKQQGLSDLLILNRKLDENGEIK